MTDDSAALAAATPAIESRDSRSLAASKQQAQAQEKKPEKKYANDINSNLVSCVALQGAPNSTFYATTRDRRERKEKSSHRVPYTSVRRDRAR